jgi:hypothetical protein
MPAFRAVDIDLASFAVLTIAHRTATSTAAPANRRIAE